MEVYKKQTFYLYPKQLFNKIEQLNLESLLFYNIVIDFWLFYSIPVSVAQAE